MLFGRKTPPAAPKTDSVAPMPPARPTGPGDAIPGNATNLSPATVSPMASLATPMPAPAPDAALRPTYSDPTTSAKGPEMNTSSPKPPTAPSLPGAGFKTDVPRRVVDTPGIAPRQPTGLGAPSAPAAPTAAAPLTPPLPPMPEQRRLIVGRDISLSGEIGSCDVLVVEGNVEAKLREGRSIEIADSGLFKGSVEIDEADIGGRFEGDITVRGRLTVRSTGKITGSITYGELAVEAGGQLIGDIKIFTSAPKASTAAAAAAIAPAPVQTDAPAPSFAPVNAG